MTVPVERKHAVLNVERFLLDLCNPRATPRVPKNVREQARRLLKHYPSKFDMDRASVQAPDVFGELF